MNPTLEQSKKRIVIVDNDYIIRQQLKNVLGNSTNAEIYSSENGVEGIGLCILVDPDVIIIDSTLPKYSGKELVEFLNSNPKFNSPGKTVIVLNENNSVTCDVQNCYNLSKNDPQLLNRITEIISTDKKINSFNLGVAQTTIRLANNADIVYGKLNDQKQSLLSYILKPFLFLQWIFLEIFTSILLSFSYLLFKKIDDTNIDQHKIDSVKYRSRVIPTLATGIAAILITLLQALIFVSGGIIILNTRVISVFADRNTEYKLNLANSTYDSSKVEVVDGLLRLKKIETIIPDTTPQAPDSGTGITEPVVEPAPEEESETTEETTPVEQPAEEPVVPPVVPVEPAPAPPVEPTPVPPVEPPSEPEVLGVNEENATTAGTVSISYSSDHPSVIFNDKIEFTKLMAITHQVSSTSSVSVDGLVTYQLSPDKENWYYFNAEKTWEKTTAGFSSSNKVKDLNDNLAKYIEVVGGNIVYLKIYLNSNGSEDILVSEIKAERELNIISEINIPEPEADEELTEIVLDLDQVQGVSFPVSVSSPTEDITPVSFPVEESIGNLPELVVLNAADASGNKVVAGRINDEKIVIKSEDISKFRVDIYFTSNTDITNNAGSSNSLIGTTKLQEVNINGDIQYVFELRTPASPGGYVVAQLIYVKTNQDGTTEEVKSELSKPLES